MISGNGYLANMAWGGYAVAPFSVGAVAIGLQTKMVRQTRAVVDADDGVGVARVEGEKHPKC